MQLCAQLELPSAHSSISETLYINTHTHTHLCTHTHTRTHTNTMCYYKKIKLTSSPQLPYYALNNQIIRPNCQLRTKKHWVGSTCVTGSAVVNSESSSFCALFFRIET